MISIIVPAYNSEKTIKKCLHSILEQTYKNFEVILVDDGSTDLTKAICMDFVNLDKRFKYYYKENGGLSDARNFGLKMATGDYYSFIDSDDYIHKDFYKESINLFNKYNADIVSFDLMIVNEDMKEYEYNIKKEKEAVLEKNEALKEYLSPRKKRYIHHGLCMKVYKKSLFDNLIFEKGRFHEDLFITYKLIEKANVFIYKSLPYYFYFQNNSSITHNISDKNIVDIYDAMNVILTYYKNNSDIYSFSVALALSEYINYIAATKKDIFKNRTNGIILDMKKFVNKNLFKNSALSIFNRTKLIIKYYTSFIF